MDGNSYQSDDDTRMLSFAQHTVLTAIFGVIIVGWFY